MVAVLLRAYRLDLEVAMVEMAGLSLYSTLEALARCVNRPLCPRHLH